MLLLLLQGANIMAKTAIVPTRMQDFSQWYQQVIKAADMAEVSPVRGCMVIKPWGYAIWERMQRLLDDRIKATGHQNIYCPLLIPKSYLEREAKHVTGFAKECAVVTHHRLESDDEGHLQPAGPLEEPYVIRPTSETMIGELFSKWIQSYRDLPLLVNQWANVMRWEMRTRLFLRTSEFLWQEGHTAHASQKEAQEETLKMLREYERFAKDHMAMPVLVGEKTAVERFPGAEATYCIEAMMQDGKALQAGTSHFLGQNFSRSFDIGFSDATGEKALAWTTSWGVSTRLIGALIMTHADDDGLVLPPSLAPHQVVILPLLKDEATRERVLLACEQLAERLRQCRYAGEAVRVHVDVRDMRGGEKTWSWVKKGVPVRIEIGLRELEAGELSVKRRDQPYQARMSMTEDALVKGMEAMLQEQHQVLLKRAQQYQSERTEHFEDRDAFDAYFSQDKPGFATAYYAEDEAVEKTLKQTFSVTARCLPLDVPQAHGACLFAPTKKGRLAVFAKAY
jgi:prolyl-tRNA synthetase